MPPWNQNFQIKQKNNNNIEHWPITTHVTVRFCREIEHCSIRLQNLAPEKFGTRSHDRRARNRCQFSGAGFWSACHWHNCWSSTNDANTTWKRVSLQCMFAKTKSAGRINVVMCHNKTTQHGLMLLTSVMRRRIVEVHAGGSATWGTAMTSEPLSSSLETTSATSTTMLFP